MSLVDLKQAIKNKTLAKCYVFYGEETSILKKYLLDMKELFQGSKNCFDTNAIIPMLYSNSLFITPNTLYICYHDQDFLKEEKQWDKLLNHNSKSCVVLIYDSLDARGKFYNKFKSSLVEFPKLSEDVLRKRLFIDTSLSEKSIDRLINRCGGSYSEIQYILQKVKILSESNNIGQEQAFIQCIEDGQVPILNNEGLNDFVDALMSRDAKRSFYLWDLMIKKKEPTLKVITYIYNTMKTTLQIQSYNNSLTITQDLGIDKWLIKQVLPYKNIYTTKELVQNMKALMSIDESIKTTDVDDALLFETFMIGCLL